MTDTTSLPLNQLAAWDGSWRPALFRSAGLYSTAIASKSDGVSPRAPRWGLGHTGDDPWRGDYLI